MAQFLAFGSGFNDYFNINRRNSSEGESGSEKIVCLKIMSVCLVCPGTYQHSMECLSDDYLSNTIIR